MLNDIQEDIIRALRARFGYAGQVLVDPSLKDKVVPFLSKNADLDRGTRIKFDERLYLYFLCKWIQPKHTRTDLDLSCVIYDDNWKADLVYFRNQANKFIAHSGDLTNAPAPHGATEYARIDMTAIPHNVRYIAPIINVFTVAILNENDEAYACFMFSDSLRFDIKRDHVRYGLTQTANANVPFVIDVKNQEIIIVDYNNRQKLGMTAHSEIENMKNLISATLTKNFITNGVLAKILSGDDNNVSITISESGMKQTIAPKDLYSIFAK